MPAGAVSPPPGLRRLRPPGWVWGAQGGLCPAVIYCGARQNDSVPRSGAEHAPGYRQRGALPAPSPDTLPAPGTAGAHLAPGLPAAPDVKQSCTARGAPLRAPPPRPAFPSAKHQDEGRGHATPGRMRPQGRGGGQGRPARPAAGGAARIRPGGVNPPALLIQQRCSGLIQEQLKAESGPLFSIRLLSNCS